MKAAIVNVYLVHFLQAKICIQSHNLIFLDNCSISVLRKYKTLDHLLC